MSPDLPENQKPCNTPNLFRPQTRKLTTDQSIDIKSVIDAVDIVSLALEYGLDLYAQTNGEYICLCPFHDDCETMSMRIYPQTGTFTCFGCGAGSSIFDFVMKMEGIEFKDALYRLASMAGYSDVFTLRDLNFGSSDDSFFQIREEIEATATRRARIFYNELRDKGNVPLFKLFEEFDGLWKWYDKNQRIFDKKLLLEKTDPAVLIVKLYRFYEVFLCKLNELKTLWVREGRC